TPAICVPRSVRYSHVLFFNDASPPEPYTLSLHDALPISQAGRLGDQVGIAQICRGDLQRRDIEIRQSIDTWLVPGRAQVGDALRSEEHTSELQSRENLVCRLLLEKKKTPSHIRESAFNTY